MRVQRQTDGRTDVTKLIVAFRRFVNAPKDWESTQQLVSHVGLFSQVACLWMAMSKLAFFCFSAAFICNVWRQCKLGAIKFPFKSARKTWLILFNATFKLWVDIEMFDVIYTGFHRWNGQNFGRVFLMLNYTDITQNTYIQSWTVTEIMAREVWNFDSCYILNDYQIHIKTGRNMWFL